MLRASNRLPLLGSVEIIVEFTWLGAELALVFAGCILFAEFYPEGSSSHHKQPHKVPQAMELCWIFLLLVLLLLAHPIFPWVGLL